MILRLAKVALDHLQQRPIARHQPCRAPACSTGRPKNMGQHQGLMASPKFRDGFTSAIAKAWCQPNSCISLLRPFVQRRRLIMCHRPLRRTKSATRIRSIDHATNQHLKERSQTRQRQPRPPRTRAISTQKNQGGAWSTSHVKFLRIIANLPHRTLQERSQRNACASIANSIGSA